MKIVVLDGFVLNPNDLSWDALQQLGELTVYDRTAPADVVSRIGDAEAVLTNKAVLDGKVLAQLPHLKYIGVLATGYNVVDLEAARRQGVVVTNVPAYSTESVAQMVFAHLLNITQRVGYYAERNREGAWTATSDFSYYDMPLIELSGKRIGVVGYGNTGQAVTRIALAFGMKVSVFTSKPQSALPDGCIKVADMDDIFRSSDVVTLHCPLTPDTDQLVNAARLSLMKQGAVLINTGRGGLVDEAALADALRSGKLLAAGLDVLTSEPPKAENPLLKLDNCFVTPHIAWATREARGRLMAQVAANVKAFIEGHVINNVAQ